MRILVLGGDGYCGWPTALHLSNRGHEIAVVDSFVRRSWDHELGAQTLTPILPLSDRLRIWRVRSNTAWPPRPIASAGIPDTRVATDRSPSWDISRLENLPGIR